jgi:hypothetical protein
MTYDRSGRSEETMKDSMTKRDEHALAGKSGSEHSLCVCCGHTGKTGDCGDCQDGNRTGRSLSLCVLNASFVRSSVPVARANAFFLLSLYLLPPTPIMLNRRQLSTAPAASSNAPPAGKLFFMLVLASRRIVAMGARNTASCPQMGLFCASAQSSCVPQSPSTNTTPVCHGLLSSPLTARPLLR